MLTTLCSNAPSEKHVRFSSSLTSQERLMRLLWFVKAWHPSAWVISRKVSSWLRGWHGLKGFSPFPLHTWFIIWFSTSMIPGSATCSLDALMPWPPGRRRGRRFAAYVGSDGHLTWRERSFYYLLQKFRVGQWQLLLAPGFGIQHDLNDNILIKAIDINIYISYIANPWLPVVRALWSSKKGCWTYCGGILQHYCFW